MKSKLLSRTMKLAWVAVIAFVTVFSACKKDNPDPDPDPVIVDGIYLKGTATGMDVVGINSLMEQGRIEGDGFSSDERTDMYEKIMYLAVGDLTIFEKSGATEMNYGAKTSVEADSLGNNSQIFGTFTSGTYEDGASAITISTAGLYHVILDKTTTKYYIIPITEWGIIGDATPNGWSAQVDMTQGALSASSGEWTVSDIELRAGSFKFRYNDGWKLDVADFVLFSNIGTDGSSSWRMGGDGWQISIADAGIYNVKFNWSLENGFSYTATKTGDLPLTDWTGVICDAVGTGVSSDNTNAVPDPSGWNWGNKLLADGEPVLTGDVYTWTWTDIILEADQGFKLRTEDGVAPSNGNGASFDVGFSAVDTDASSTNVADASGNISVTVKTNYNIVLTIDAGNGDIKSVVITEGTK